MRLREIKTMTITSLALAFALAALVAAQQPARSGRRKQPRGEQMISMDKMRKECQKYHQEAAKSLDRTKKTMEEAERSNDLARMRTVLEQARKSLAEMETQMSKCMEMMDATEKTRGKGQKEKTPGGAGADQRMVESGSKKSETAPKQPPQ
jgi:exonuclease VII large subunit